MNIKTELEESELTRLFAVTGALHQNFYEDGYHQKRWWITQKL